MSNISKFLVIQKGRKRKQGLELLNLMLFLVITVASLTLIAGLGQLRTYAEEMPSEEIVKENLANRGENSRIYDRNGNLLYTFRDPDRDRVYVEYEDIPPVVIAAVLAGEDKDFYMHEGINFVATFRSLVNNAAGENVQGGSTVTQQLVKQTLLSPEQTVERKIQEAMVAMLVERDYSKQEIMEYYLNVVNLGGRVIGIRTGAATYFNKNLDELTLEEAAFLVALLQSPGEYSPLFANDRERATELATTRRNHILRLVSENERLLNYLNEDDEVYLSGAGNDVLLMQVNPSYTAESVLAKRDEPLRIVRIDEELRAPHWVFYIRDLLGSEPYNLSITELYSGGYNIYTSLDIEIQELAERKLKEGVDRLGPSYNFHNGALVSMDPRSGEVLAMVGSKGYDLPNDPNDRRFDPQTNVATSLRNLGSTLKPWVAYLGIAEGRYSRFSTIEDSPQTFYGYYRPRNFDGRFNGDMTVQQALLDSRNLPFIKMLYQMGDWKLGDLMQNIGYRTNTQYGLAASVGGVSETLLSHTHAYTGLANGGQLMELTPLLRIEDSSGDDIFVAENNVKYEFNRGAVADVNAVLGYKPYQPGNYVYRFIGAQKLAGKTGTSDANKDTFYMGYGPKVMTGVWAGNNDNTRMAGNALGSTTTLIMWNWYMTEFFQEFPEYSEFGSY